MSVVDFKPLAKPRESEFPVEQKKRDYTKATCHHNAVFVDDADRIVECQTCGVPVDPIAFIAKLGAAWDRERWRVRTENALAKAVIYLHQAGGRITIRPSGVVVDLRGERWASSVSGGVTQQMDSALDRAEVAIHTRLLELDPKHEPPQHLRKLKDPRYKRNDAFRPPTGEQPA